MKRFVIAVGAVLCDVRARIRRYAAQRAEETKSAVAAAAAWGCEGGKWEKETEGTGVFELMTPSARTARTTT